MFEIILAPAWRHALSFNHNRFGFLHGISYRKNTRHLKIQARRVSLMVRTSDYTYNYVIYRMLVNSRVANNHSTFEREADTISYGLGKSCGNLVVGRFINNHDSVASLIGFNPDPHMPILTPATGTTYKPSLPIGNLGYCRSP